MVTIISILVLFLQNFPSKRSFKTYWLNLSKFSKVLKEIEFKKDRITCSKCHKQCNKVLFRTQRSEKKEKERRIIASALLVFAS